MNKHFTYDFITQKMERRSSPDSHVMWMDMKSILDKEMPEKKDKRRYLVWFCVSACLITALSVGGYYLLGSQPVHQQNDQSVRTNNPTQNHASSVAPSESGNEPVTLKTEEGTGSKLVSVGTKSNGTKAHTLANPAGSTVARSLGQHSSHISTASVSKRSRTGKTGNSTNSIIVHKSAVAKKTPKEPKPNEPSQPLIKKKQSAAADKDSSAHKSAAYRYNSQLTGTEILNLNRQYTRLEWVSLMRRATYQPPAASARTDIAGLPAHPFRKIAYKGFVAGLAMNLNLPVSRQEMSTTSINGSSNPLFDYLPSVYVQYHFNNKWSVQSELQYVSPQYTPKLDLVHRITELGTDQKTESNLTLNKLYYLNLPVSVRYSPVPRLTLGSGLQYSYLRRSVFVEEQTSWQKGVDDWKKTSQTRTVKVKSNPQKEEKQHSGNGNGGSNPPAMTAEDTVAQSFRSNDWRLLFEASYRWRKFNMGLRYNVGLDDYIHTKVGSSIMEVSDRNKSFQLYLQYQIIDRRKRSKF